MAETLRLRRAHRAAPVPGRFRPSAGGVAAAEPACRGPSNTLRARPAPDVLRQLRMKAADGRRQKLIVAAAARKSLSHPHLVPARVVRDDAGRMRIRLQSHPAPTLSEVLASGPLEVRESLRLLYNVATAVDALNEAGLVARDLRPDRILVCPQRGGILVDAGIPVEVLPRGPDSHDLDATCRSPEELAGRPIDARSNVYSLGAVFLATVTAPDGERLALPAPVRAVTKRAMATAPRRRYASAPEFVITLASAFGFRHQVGSGGRRTASKPSAQDAQHRPAEPDASTLSHAGTEPPAAPDPRRPEPRAHVDSHVAPPAAPEPTQTESADRETSPDPDPPSPEREPEPVGPVTSERRGPGAGRRERVRARPRLRPPARPHLRLPLVRRLRVSRVSPIAVGIGAAIIACLLVGILLVRGVAKDADSTKIGSPAFTIELPAGWRETRVARTGGIELTASVAAAPADESGTGLVAGRVPDLLALDRRFRGDDTRKIQLGRLRAWRYTGLHPGRGLTATAYLAPTSGAPLLVICHARTPEARTRLRECEEIAATIALRGERPASLAKIDAHRERIASVMSNLRQQRVRLRRRLATVRLATGQARAARDLERAYRLAASRLQRAERPEATPPLDDLVGSLRDAAGAYGRLARAAEDVHKLRYRSAKGAVVAAERAVEDEAIAAEAA
jgi:Protein tyrosine and serine/threonine kinase